MAFRAARFLIVPLLFLAAAAGAQDAPAPAAAPATEAPALASPAPAAPVAEAPAVAPPPPGPDASGALPAHLDAPIPRAVRDPTPIQSTSVEQPPAEPAPKPVETAFFADAVAAGQLPPVDQRIPADPSVVHFSAGNEPGQPGGTMRIIAGSAKDTRTLVVYGYARLVGYDDHFNIVPDLAKSVDVEEGRRFTFHLRRGHKWSDGAPFTSEDFRYFWQDIATNKEMSKFGPPAELLVGGEKPVVEFPDDVTVRYTWTKPNPYFLPALAGAQPLEIFRPSHYLKQFHKTYADADTLAAMVKEHGQRNWVALHFAMDRSYRNDNLDMPTLQPWVLKTDPPSDRFIFERNPYYHRIDEAGHQLPYVDRVTMTVASPSLVAAKVGGGEADLQAAYLTFANYTFLKQAERRSGFYVRRWLPAKGAKIALYPNLNSSDPVWRDLFRNVDLRRALSVAINREDINNAIFYGLGSPGNNTVLKESPLFRDEYRTKWTQYDPALADKLLDGLGLTERNSAGFRLLPDGREMQIVVETAGEDTEQTDVLELIRDDWARIGVALFIKPSQREVFYNRIKAGSTQMAIWTGLENALPNAQMSPAEFMPLNGEQYEWPAWGLWMQTQGTAGEKPSDPVVMSLIDLKSQWSLADDPAAKADIWGKILTIWADQVFTIGIVSEVDQLVVVSNKLRNVPKRGIYNFEPGAFFGMYRPDTFWFSEPEANASAETN